MSNLKNFWGETKELLQFVIIAAIIVIPIRMYIAQPFIVKGASMVPNFHNGDYLIVDEISYRFTEPKRGEVIVLKNAHKSPIFLIKRIIGLPGERIYSDGSQIFIEKDEEIIELNEPYVDDRQFGKIDKTLGSNEYFVMGDNRSESLDSRSWGPLERENIKGRALLRLFPLNKISFMPEVFNNY